jgi:sRNA-binding regulator protein Hfq
MWCERKETEVTLASLPNFNGYFSPSLPSSSFRATRIFSGKRGSAASHGSAQKRTGNTERLKTEVRVEARRGSLIDNKKSASVPGKPVTPPLKAQVVPSKPNSAPQPQQPPCADVKPAAELQQQPEKKARIDPEAMFYSAAKAQSKAVVVRMKSGREHVGRVAGFGHYNVEIETEAGPVLLYKAAIESAKFGS